MADVTTALTGASSATGRGSVAPGVTIRLTGVAATGRNGTVDRYITPFQGLTLTVPPVTLSLGALTGVTGTLDLRAPAPTLAMVGAVPTPLQLALTVPAPSLRMAGLTGQQATLALQAPMPTLRLGGSDGLNLRVPLPQLALAGHTGNTAIFAPRVALPALSMTAITDQRAALDLRSPLPTLKMAGDSGAVAKLYLTVPSRIALALRGVAGTTGTLALTAPMPQLVFRGGFAATGTLALTAPMPQLLMQGFTTSTGPVVTANRVTYAMQTERMALSHYTNFPFNSFATFQGKLLGASDSGIFELVGDTDNGVPITCEARTGVTDMNTSRIKRVDRVYIGYRAQKGMQSLILRVMTNETQRRDYGVPASINTMLHGARTRLGMGMDSRYWQFGILNRNGQAFTLDSIEVAPVVYNRRRGSKDA